jgi:hypothetical protein
MWLWHSSAEWRWYDTLFLLGAAVMPALSEYAFSVFFLSAAALNLISKLAHTSHVRALKILGTLGIAVGFVLFAYIIKEVKGVQEWSHLSSPARGIYSYLWPPKLPKERIPKPKSLSESEIEVQVSTNLPTLFSPPSISTKTNAKPKPQLPETRKSPGSPVQSELYPIIVVTATRVTSNTDTHKIEMFITLANETSTEVNAHISTQTLVMDSSGTEMQTEPSDERDIGFAPPPFAFQLHKELRTTPEGETNYANGVVFITMTIAVSYSDRGGKTIYHFKGKTNPKLDHLDIIQSEWEQVSQH